MNYGESYTEPPQNITGNHTVPNVIRRPNDLNVTKAKPMEDFNNSTQNESTTSILITKIVEGVKNGSEVVNKSDSSPATLPMCESSSDLGKQYFHLA